MNSTKSHIRSQVEQSLQTIIDQSVDSLGREATVAAVEQVLAKLQSRQQARQCQFSTSDGRPTLIIEYPGAASLRADRSALLEMRGLMVTVAPAPPLMEEIEIRIQRQDRPQSVVLRGRAVHHSPDGAAIEIFAAADQHKAIDQLIAAPAPEEPPPERSSSDPVAEPAAPGTPSSASPATAPASPPSSAPTPAQYPVNRLIALPDEPTRTWHPDADDLEAILLALTKVEGYAVLDVNHRAGRQHFVIHFGKLIDVRCDPFEDSEEELIAELSSSGLVEPSMLERAEALARIHGITRQDALIDIGCISLEQLLATIRQCLIQRIDNLWSLSIEEAHLYELSHRPPLRLRRSSVDLGRQLTRRIEARLSQLSKATLQTRAQRFAGTQLVCRPPYPLSLDALELDEQSQRFITVILNTPRALSDIRRVAHLRGAQLLRILLLLDELGFLTRETKNRRLPDQNLIEGLSQQVANDNHFEVLGIHWSAHQDEVERAYQELQEKLAVDPQTRDAMSDELQRIQEKIDRAYKVLLPDRSRRAYRDKTVDDFAQRSALQVYEKKLDTQRMRQNSTKLVDSLSRIVELDPTNKKARKQLASLKRALDNSQ